MLRYPKKLIVLAVRCLLFGLIGGTLFTVISGHSLGLIPYVIAMGAGAGWQFTRPLGVVAVGENGLILSAVLLTLRVGLALVIGWVILPPYIVYLAIQTVRVRGFDKALSPNKYYG